MATDIIPAIMPKTRKDLEEKMSRVASIVSLVQLDIMDGIFVPEKTWPYGDREGFEKILKEKEGFPMWDSVDFEADLMISDPIKGVEEWISAGARRVIVHIESVEGFGKIVEVFKTRAPAKDSLFYIELGIALNPDTPVEKIMPFVRDVDFIQFMGIAKIGYQSQPFDKRVLDQIRELRKSAPDSIISVDGGVSLETAPLLVDAGANRLVSGSVIFNSPNIKETVEEFNEILNGTSR